jgi:hypothetical protein
MCTRFVSGACQRPQPLKDTSLPTRPNPLKPLHTNGRSDTIMQASTSLSVDAQALQAAPIYGQSCHTPLWGSKSDLGPRCQLQCMSSCTNLPVSAHRLQRAVQVARSHFRITGEITLGTIISDSTESYAISPEAWSVICPTLRVVLVWASTNTVDSGPGTINSVSLFCRKCVCADSRA